MKAFKQVMLGLALMAGLAAPSLAATYHFANCATGCLANANIANAACDTAGSAANPFCLDPQNDGTNDSFACLQDRSCNNSVDPLLAAGDTIKLCATDCDGADTGTFFVS